MFNEYTGSEERLRQEAQAAYEGHRQHPDNEATYWEQRLPMECERAFLMPPDEVDGRDRSIRIGEIQLFWEEGFLDDEGFVLKVTCPKCGKGITSPAISNLAQLGKTLKEASTLEGHTCRPDLGDIPETTRRELYHRITAAVDEVLFGER